jgi:hypothetical protein
MTLRKKLEEARSAWGETGEIMLDSGLRYGDGEAVMIHVRKRGHRYDIDDGGAAWRKTRACGRRALDAADRLLAREGLNVNRRGVIFVPAVEGRDVAALAERLAAASLDVYGELLELDT